MERLKGETCEQAIRETQAFRRSTASPCGTGRKQQKECSYSLVSKKAKESPKFVGLAYNCVRRVAQTCIDITISGAGLPFSRRVNLAVTSMR